MRIIGFIFYLALSISLANAAEWIPNAKSGLATSWRHQKLSEHRIAFRETAISSNFNKVEYGKKIIRSKKKLLAFIGVKDWKIEKQYWKEGAYYLRGSYLDRNNRLISFFEAHQFKNKFIYQYLYTCPSLEKDKFSEKELIRLFKGGLN